MFTQGARVLTWVLPVAGLALLVGLSARADDTDPEPKGSFPQTTAKHRTISANNLKQILLAMHGYHDANGALPKDICDKKGKPILSWRIHLLPYLEQQNLYKEFKLDEPWDSKHNKTLLKKMPAIFAPTIIGKPAKAFTTYYQVFTGPDTVYPPRAVRGLQLTQITDGTSNTALVVEAGQPVLWSKPDDIVYNAKKPVPKLGGLFKEGFHIALGDGSVRFIDRKADATQLRYLITPSGGEVVDWNKLPAPKKK